MQPSSKTPNSVVYVDEAGTLGRTSRLTPAHDGDLGLFVGIVCSGTTLTDATAAFAPALKRFRDAAPSGAKLHITDAFASGNEDWARIAESVRAEAYELVLRLQIPIVFEAQRLRDLREARDALATMEEKASEGRRSGIEVKQSGTKERVELELLQMLLEKLEVYGDEARLNAIEVRFDDVDTGLFKTYARKLEELRGIDDKTEIATGYERATDTVHHGEVRIRLRQGSAAVTRVQRLAVVGKNVNDPLVLLVDVVANSLNEYFTRLDLDAPLDETGTEAWVLGAAVWPRA